MDFIQANINNLTALWTIGGKLAGQYIQESSYRLSLAQSGEWPNKLWCTEPMDVQTLLDIRLKWNQHKLSFPVWGDDAETLGAMLKERGFEEKLTQVAMSINLENTPDHVGQIIVQKVTSKPMAEIWSQLFQQAFGYEISADAVSKTMKPIEYFIATYKGVPVGVAVLFIDQQGVAGIHSMGIIPSQRRRGYAEELLIHVMDIARMKGATYAILQASNMGKGLYLKLGFREDFIIKTFIESNN